MEKFESLELSEDTRKHKYVSAEAEHALDIFYTETFNKASALVRYDTESSHENQVDSASMDIDSFKSIFEDVTGLHPGTLNPKEVFYLSRLFSNADTEFKNRLKVFFSKHGMQALHLAIATEYYPSLMYQVMILEVQLGEDVEGLDRILILFEDLYSIVENISEIIEEKSGEGIESRQISLQVFEALVRKAVDILELWQMSFTNSSKKHQFDTKDIDCALKMYHSCLFMIYVLFSEGSSREISSLDTKKGQMPKFKYVDIAGKEAIIKFFTRSKADASGQARINFEIDFNTDKPMIEQQQFFNQSTERLKDGSVIKVEDESVFRLSFDRDTTHESPIVSLDICRAAYSGKTMNRTGDKLGNIFAAASEEGNHTPYSFDPKFAEEERFASIAETFSRYISDLHATKSQTVHQMSA